MAVSLAMVTQLVWLTLNTDASIMLLQFTDEQVVDAYGSERGSISPEHVIRIEWLKLDII